MTTTSRHLLAVTTIVAPTAVPVTAAAADRGPVVRADGPLRDLQPATAGPFDTASASFQLVESAKGSHALLQVRGIGETSHHTGTAGARLACLPVVW